MKTTLAILAVLLWGTQFATARPFETQAQVEARTGGRVCNGEETSDYEIMSYIQGDLIVWVLYMGGLSEGEIYFKNGPLADLEVAGFLDSNKGQSIWQLEKMEGGDKKTTAKAWSRKDGNLYALQGFTNGQSIFLIGTKKAQRIMGDMNKLESRLKPRDRMQ